MRKTLAALLAVALLGLGSAFAQDGMMGDQFWVGVSGGFPGAAVHFGFADLVDGLDVRANLGFNYAGATGFAVGVDALYSLPLDTGIDPLDVYVGGGPGFAFNGGFAVNVFGGAEYSLVDFGLPEGAVFLEVGPTIPIPSFNVGFGARLGFNYYF